LFNIDDLGWTDLTFQGSKYYETPNVDKLRSSGIFFSQAYAGASNSAPSRACLMTGQYTPRHGIYTVDPPDRGKSSDRKLIPCTNRIDLRPDQLTLPQILKNAGYQTANLGKRHIMQ